MDFNPVVLPFERRVACNSISTVASLIFELVHQVTALKSS